MINRKHLKAMLFAGFLGVMTLASTVPSMAATGWNKVSGFIMTAAAISAKDGWEPPMGLTIIWISPQGR